MPATSSISPCKLVWVKNDVMLKVLRTKFAQHENLKEQLVTTVNRYLVVQNKFDKYWGVAMVKITIKVKICLVKFWSRSEKRSKIVTKINE